MEKHQVQIDIDDYGVCSVSSDSKQKTQACVAEIKNMIKDIETGEEFDAKVVRLENYGAFVELVPGHEALLHISEMSQGFVKDVHSLVKLGDIVHVRVSGRNNEGQIKLEAPEFKLNHLGQTQSKQPSTIGKFRPPRN
jgi:polyribonucleotide nucleotidyltransferase